MIKSSIEKLSETIGFEIGTSDDVTQSNLINGFCKGLSNSIIQKNDLDMQLCYIVDKLDEKSCSIILALSEFIKLNKAESI